MRTHLGDFFDDLSFSSPLLLCLSPLSLELELCLLLLGGDWVVWPDAHLCERGVGPLPEEEEEVDWLDFPEDEVEFLEGDRDE